MPDPDERLAAAPLLAHLHERHPDVDIVVLPPEPEPELRPTPVSDAALDSESREVRAALGALLNAAGAGAEGVDPTYRWHAATTSGRVVAVGQARMPVAPDTYADLATSLAEDVARAAEAAGWVGRWRTQGSTLVLDLEREGRSARVVRLDPAVLVSVTGRELPVSDTTLRSLVGTDVVLGE